jgi:regulator of protease activity HflC (stomatin/prohibitin superfamily)
MKEKFIATWGFIGIVVVILLIALGSGVYSVDAGETGVLLRGGDIVGTEAPGYGWKTPFITKMEQIDNRVQTKNVKTEAYTSDQQPVELQLAITYRVPAGKASAALYRDYGDVDTAFSRIVLPQLDSVKSTFSQYDAASAVQKRAQLSTQISENFKKALAGKTNDVSVDSIQLIDISFSQDYETAVNQRMQRQVEVAKQQQELDRVKIEAQQQVAQADAKAQAIKAVADANAYKTLVEGKATAQAIKMKSDALAANKQLVQYTFAERWNGVYPTTYMAGNKASIPLINIGSAQSVAQDK